MSSRDRLVALLLALVLISVLAMFFARDSILLLVGVFVFLALDPHVKSRLARYSKCFAIEVSLAMALIVSIFFSIRLFLPDPVSQATVVALALLGLGFKLIVFPVYESHVSNQSSGNS